MKSQRTNYLPEGNQTILIKVFYSPTEAQLIVLKNIIKIYIKTAPTCFCAVTPSSGGALFLLAKVTVIKIINYGISCISCTVF
jgi:hypothetical protein